MSSKKWGSIYFIVVVVFTAIYYIFWLVKPDSFIINPELNIHPFYDINSLLWIDGKYDYRGGNIISLSELKTENDKFFLESSKSTENLNAIKIEIIQIRNDLDKLSAVRNVEFDKNSEAYDKKELHTFIVREKEIELEITNLEKKLPLQVKTQEDIDFIRLVGEKRLELAELRVKKAHQAYLNSEFILRNISDFISQETHNRYAELSKKESETYEDQYQLEKSMKNNRSIALDKVEILIKEYRNKLGAVDFFYFSVGISTTTTFGDIVANNRMVRAVVSIQLILCIFIIGGFVNSVITRDAKK